MRRSKRVNVVAVDTGLSALGYAVWLNVKTPSTTVVAPMTCGVIKGKNTKSNDPLSWVKDADQIITDFYSALDGTGYFNIDPYPICEPPPCYQVLEWPEFRSSSMGLAAASSVLKLAYMCGMHGGVANPHVKHVLAPVRDWKGQLPKEIVNKRIVRAIGRTAEDGTKFGSHAWDAVGIGLWWLGFKFTNPIFAKKT